ncbi:MAG: hypothetical protein KKB81_02585 [Candidatus Margulisbacteria bacterium]|nr:hypothetical protein [Candidatus Margulisiibacteriota bacterium]MBU1022139.1 hypothetical protein [Candidatus Margulisiibacteriota bacterium]MBU1729422.1 hypothetical protein [Candidatus Margulisiibacteriota bacterium]MBU1955695.1 hypothetical protein [Candidatus Margulisiibacteriota bacterium]
MGKKGGPNLIEQGFRQQRQQSRLPDPAQRRGPKRRGWGTPINSCGFSDGQTISVGDIRTGVVKRDIGIGTFVILKGIPKDGLLRNIHGYPQGKRLEVKITEILRRDDEIRIELEVVKEFADDLAVRASERLPISRAPVTPPVTDIVTGFTAGGFSGDVFGGTFVHVRGIREPFAIYNFFRISREHNITVKRTGVVHRFGSSSHEIVCDVGFLPRADRLFEIIRNKEVFRAASSSRLVYTWNEAEQINTRGKMIASNRPLIFDGQCYYPEGLLFGDRLVEDFYFSIAGFEQISSGWELVQAIAGRNPIMAVPLVR